MARLFVFGSELEIIESDPSSGRGEADIASSGPLRTIDPLKLEAAFLDHCLRHGWIAIEHAGESYTCFLTPAGEHELARFGLTHLY